MIALEQSVPLELDLELVIAPAIEVLPGDRVLDGDGGEHQVVRTVLWPGQMRLVADDGWVETVGVDELVGIVVRGVA